MQTSLLGHSLPLALMAFQVEVDRVHHSPVLSPSRLVVPFLLFSQQGNSVFSCHCSYLLSEVSETTERNPFMKHTPYIQHHGCTSIWVSICLFPLFNGVFPGSRCPLLLAMEAWYWLSSLPSGRTWLLSGFWFPSICRPSLQPFSPLLIDCANLESYSGS